MNKQQSHEVSTQSNTQDFLARLEQKALRVLPQDLSFDQAVVFVATGSEEQVNEFRLSDIDCPVEWLGSDPQVRRASKFLDDCARKGRITITGVLGIEAQRNHIPVDSYPTLSLNYYPGRFACLDPVSSCASRDFAVPSKEEGRNLDILSGCLDDFLGIEPEDLRILRGIKDLLIRSSDLEAVISDLRGNDEPVVYDRIAIEADDCDNASQMPEPRPVKASGETDSEELTKARQKQQKEILQEALTSIVKSSPGNKRFTKADVEKVATGKDPISLMGEYQKFFEIDGRWCLKTDHVTKAWKEAMKHQASEPDEGKKLWTDPGRPKTK